MIIDLSALSRRQREAVAYGVRHDFDKKLFHAMREQKIAANALRRNRPVRREGVGAQKMAIHPLFHWVARQKYGEDAKDPAFWDWCLKHEDAFRVNTQPEKIMVSMSGPRFKKTY